MIIILVLSVIIVLALVILYKRALYSVHQVGFGVSVSNVNQVDWSKTFPGIDQPNEAYSVVLNKNIAYEQTQRAQRQRDSGSHNPTTSEGIGGEYEDIEPAH